jgi:hypothetical protein
MNSIPQVATAELSDAHLDNVSGGLAADVSGGGFLHAAAGPLCVDVFTAGSAEGVTAGVSVHAAH